MRKKFSNYAEALQFGREFSDRAGTKVYVVSVCTPGGNTYWVFSSAGNGGAFRTAWVGADYGPGGRWYFGGACRYPTAAEASLLLSLPELPELPGKQESWYALVAAYTAGWTHEQKLLLARRCDETDAGVWHESHRLSLEINPGMRAECPCGPCTQKRKEMK